MKNLFFLIIMVIGLTACESKSGKISEKIQRVNEFVNSIEAPLTYVEDTIANGNRITLLTFPDSISQEEMRISVANAIKAFPNVYRVLEWESDSINKCQFGYIYIMDKDDKSPTAILIEVFEDNYLGIGVNLF